MCSTIDCTLQVRWLRSWDAAVFGSGAKKGVESRPEHRILLMSGPPGA